MRESFASLKSRVSIAMVLTHYGVDITHQERQEQIRIHCPICKYRKRPSLSVSPAKNLFRCFHDGCTQGNILDFFAAMEQCDLPAAGKKLAAIFPVGEKRPKKRQSNKPLTFELKNIDHSHESIQALGIRNTAYYGVGLYTGRGKLSGQIVCPIRDPLEQLLGYATFKISDNAVDVHYPDPEHFCIDADLYVPGIRETCTDCLAVVQSPYDAIRRHESGIDTCAYMVDAISTDQVKQIDTLRSFYKTVEL